MGLNTLKAKNSLYIPKEIRNEFLAFTIYIMKCAFGQKCTIIVSQPILLLLQYAVFLAETRVWTCHQ